MAGPLSAFSNTQRLLAIAALCLAGVGAALAAQSALAMRPCPWCILQRLIYIIIALVCIVAAVLKAGIGRTVLAGVTLLLALSGIVAAVYQHEVAAKMFSCNLTFADKLITALRIEFLWPEVFGVTATCADSAVSVLGLPFEYWSLGLFAVVGLLALSVLLRRGAR